MAIGKCCLRESDCMVGISGSIPPEYSAMMNLSLLKSKTLPSFKMRPSIHFNDSHSYSRFVCNSTLACTIMYYSGYFAIILDPIYKHSTNKMLNTGYSTCSLSCKPSRQHLNGSLQLLIINRKLPAFC